MTFVTTQTAETTATSRDAGLRVTLARVAELAQVQRPVVSMWRSRFATGADPFPAPVSRRGGTQLFDAVQVAEWLARTGHGNNSDVLADAAAAAAPVDLSFADPTHTDELDALIALQSARGSLASMSPDELVAAARATDPDDRQLASEIARHIARGADWRQFVDRLVDAAYSATEALTVTHRRRSAAAGAEGSAGVLSPAATDLLAAAATALHHQDTVPTVTVLDRGLDSETALRIVHSAGGQDADIVVPGGIHARGIRRRLTTTGIWFDDTVTMPRAVRIARVPTRPDDSIDTMLADAEAVALELAETDAALVFGPARALVDALPRDADRVRSDVLRSGRLRAVARLPRGLVPAATREPLGLWVLGAPTGAVPVDERFTAVADLVETPLTDAARSDLISDIIAGMGSARDVRSHAFRFARLVRTPSLIARGGSLIDAARRPPRSGASAHELPTLLEAAADAVADDITVPQFTPTEAAPVVPAMLTDLVAAGHARILPGTRLTDAPGDAGLVVVSAAELDDLSAIGRHRIDALALAVQHPSAQLSRPGDIIFRTGPTAAAWVDTDGSKVVAAPARILRITAADPGGLIPELVAADIAEQPAGPGAWRRWNLRRVPPTAMAPLRRALTDVADAQRALHERQHKLSHYANLLAAAIAAGAVTLTDSDLAAPAASDPQ